MAKVQELTDLVGAVLRDLAQEPIQTYSSIMPACVTMGLGCSTVHLPVEELMEQRHSAKDLMGYVQRKRDELYIEHGKSLERLYDNGKAT